MYPHRIRLRGPWQTDPLAPGTVRHRRAFGLPSRLDPFERVWLVCDGLAAPAEVSLNGERLANWTGGPNEIDVTAKLRPRNEVAFDTSAGGLAGEVALEIRREAWLADVTVRAAGDRLNVRGHVAGVVPPGLELYAVLDRSTAIYAPVPGAGPFDLTSEPVAAAGTVPVRVELVVGAVVWFRLDREVTFGTEPIS